MNGDVVYCSQLFKETRRVRRLGEVLSSNVRRMVEGE
jgi:hypothetical protein